MTNSKARSIGAYFIVYLILSAGAVVMILPFIWMASTAFKTFQETLMIPIKWFPSKLQFDNFKEVLNRLNFGRYYINTIIVTVSITIIQALFCSMAAYGFARIKFPGRGLLFIVLLSMLMIPQQMTLLPSYIILSRLQWLDTYLALIIPNLFSAYGTFFLRQFFMSLPGELEDAAIIDGSSRWGIYTRIFLPLSTTALAAFGIFTVLWAWNDLMWPLIMTSRESIRVLSVGVATLVGQYSTRNHWLMAASMLATTPMIILFIILQKQFIAGITITGLKA
jgi:multiple sugar transport system permease protein